MRHGEGYPDLSLRLFNRQYAHWSEDLVHEKIVPNDLDFQVGRLEGDLMHESGESISKYIEKQNVYTSIQAKLMREQGKKASATKIVVSPLVRFFKFYFIKGGFMDGLPGIVHIAIGCFTVFLKYVKLMSYNLK